jgi:hypothetical protein
MISEARQTEQVDNALATVLTCCKELAKAVETRFLPRQQVQGRAYGA